ncbi:hypothetical protein GCM10012287_41550 [Streptomyces daqingensis]|uniref:Uncharacterized protein n=1 Tax=Streptomyces daqingensis TaxID=1472640 RepID=A0ABQ2ML61_9ACTN|nr:hypothetical protein GCM10012287_41550 [Streptomyces daqingensis]
MPGAWRRGGRKASEHALGWRVVGLLLGSVLTLFGAGSVLVNSVQGVQATGLAGTTGTFTVDYCSDDNPTSKNSDYSCHGEFLPQGAARGDRSAVQLEDAGDDYPKGKQVGAYEVVLGSDFLVRQTGFGAVLESFLWWCFGAVVLLMGFFTSRKWMRSFRRR